MWPFKKQIKKMPEIKSNEEKDIFSILSKGYPEKMAIKEGPGWSPDGGEFWVRDGYLYWSDGTRWDMTNGDIRIGTASHNNDYSKSYHEKESHEHTQQTDIQD